MSANPQRALDASSQTVIPAISYVGCFGLFTHQARLAWLLVATLTVAPELLPVVAMSRPTFCLYYLVKVFSFLALGFIAPLAFRSLNGVGLGLVLSFFSALLMETVQGFLHNGHVFHWYELAGKLSLIVLGFAFALDCRYERRISWGPLKIYLQQNA